MSRRELTARIAYEIYLQRGRQPGRQVEDWRAAESIVAWCLAVFEALSDLAPVDAPSADTPRERTADAAGLAEPSTPLTPIPTPDPLAVLSAAVDAVGRAEVAKRLGYTSAGSVGRYLRQDRAIGDALAAKILAKLPELLRAEARRAA